MSDPNRYFQNLVEHKQNSMEQIQDLVGIPQDDDERIVVWPVQDEARRRDAIYETGMKDRDNTDLPKHWKGKHRRGRKT